MPNERPPAYCGPSRKLMPAEAGGIETAARVLDY